MRTSLAALALLLALASRAGADAPLDRAAAAIEGALASSNRPGLVIGITDRKGLRKAIVHGYADIKTRAPLTAESRFAIGSISKSFTSMALLQLADEGRFDAQAPITRYLPSFGIQSRFAPITGRDLLTHTAGLPDYLTDSASSRYAAVALHGFEASYAPGSHFEYSNTGYQLLGYVLENIEHDQYARIIRRRILEPAGMGSTSAIIDDAERSHMTVSYARWPYDGRFVESPWFEYTAGDGSIVSNVADMCAYARLILNRGVSGTKRVLSERAFATLTKPGLDDYGYGLWIRTSGGHTVVSHSGGIAGFRSYLEAHMDEGFGIVFLSNGGMSEKLRSWAIEAIAAAFAGKEIPQPPATERDRLLAEPRDYIGTYAAAGTNAPAAPGARLEITSTDGALSVRDAAGSRSLERMGVDTFRIVGDGNDTTAYFFARESSTAGKVVGLSHGNRWYVTQGFKDPVSDSPAAYATLVGHYVNNGPEGPAVRVFVRNGKLLVALFVEEELFTQPLVPLSSDTFRLGEDRDGPERARFDSVVDGHALRLTISGVPLYRRDTP